MNDAHSFERVNESHLDDKQYFFALLDKYLFVLHNLRELFVIFCFKNFVVFLFFLLRLCV